MDFLIELRIRIGLRLGTRACSNAVFLLEGLHSDNLWTLFAVKHLSLPNIITRKKPKK